MSMTPRSDWSLIEEIIARARVCRLGFSDAGRPYIVPLSFGYHERTLYFHSAETGRKVRLAQAGGEVCFEIDIDLGVVEAPQPCQWGIDYLSVIGWGEVRMVKDEQEKVRALGIIMSQYSEGEHSFPPAAVAKTCVFAVEISEATAKTASP